MQIGDRWLHKMAAFCLLTGLICWSVAAHADIKEMVKYKGAFPDVSPKCKTCHVADMPKKDDGQHELNGYGKAAVKAAGSNATSSDTYKSLGTFEDFSKKTPSAS